jgi:hypothetical protein
LEILPINQFGSSVFCLEGLFITESMSLSDVELFMLSFSSCVSFSRLCFSFCYSFSFHILRICEGWTCSSVVQHLSSMDKARQALSIPSLTKTNKQTKPKSEFILSLKQKAWICDLCHSHSLSLSLLSYHCLSHLSPLSLPLPFLSH